MMTDNTGSRRTHTQPHTHIQCADEALSWIRGELHLHIRQQKNAYANADNADSNQRAPFPPLLLLPPLPSLPFLSLFTSLSLFIAACLFLSLSLSLSGPVSPSFTISSLSPTCLKQLIAVYSLPPLNVSVLISDISKQSLVLSYQRRVYVSVAFSGYRSGSGSARALGSAGLMSG